MHFTLHISLSNSVYIVLRYNKQMLAWRQACEESACLFRHSHFCDD